MDDDWGYPYDSGNLHIFPIEEIPWIMGISHFQRHLSWHTGRSVRFVASSFCGVLGGPWATWVVASWTSNLVETMSWTNRDRGRPSVRIWIWLWNMDMIMQLCIQNDAIICFFTKRKCGKVLSHVQPIKLGNDPNWLLCWYGCLSVSSR